MSLILKENRTFVPVPEGSHIARCYALIDLGMQYSKFYDNTLPKVMIGWELTDKLMSDGRPFIHFQRYTASLNEKSSLRALLEAWRGQSFTPEELGGFKLKKILGASCYLTIKQLPNLLMQQRWARVIAICPLPKLITCPMPINKLIYFDCDNYTESDYLSVPERIRKHINRSSVDDPLNVTPTSINHFPSYFANSHEPQPDVDS